MYIGQAAIPLLIASLFIVGWETTPASHNFMSVTLFLYLCGIGIGL